MDQFGGVMVDERVPVDRRSVLRFGAAGVALATAGRAGWGSHLGGAQRGTQIVARRLIDTIETGDTAAIWAMFAAGGSVEFPFLGLPITDIATFEAVVGPLLANLSGLTFSEPELTRLAAPTGVIAKYTGHATVLSTGKPYDQIYVSEIHVRHGQVVRYVEYFDTAVLNAAFTPG